MGIYRFEEIRISFFELQNLNPVSISVAGIRKVFPDYRGFPVQAYENERIWTTGQNA